jgi:hypothetical protein
MFSSRQSSYQQCHQGLVVSPKDYKPSTATDAAVVVCLAAAECAAAAVVYLQEQGGLRLLHNMRNGAVTAACAMVSSLQHAQWCCHCVGRV